MMDIQNNQVHEEKLPLSLSEDERIQSLTRSSALIFIGLVLEIGKPPADWSGYFKAYQRVRYKIERILKGQFGASEINVDHIVVMDSKTARPGEEPGLSSSLFSKDSKLIVFADKGPNGVWINLDEDFGALAATEQRVSQIEKMMKSK
jgi:hypothetical protein